MFPSIISIFNKVNPTDRLNSPSHSALHNSVASVLTQVQTVIGTDASALGTIIGDLRSASSNGGGHIQTANKGGTGQTTFTKGDILVATSTSVLSKLAVGSDGQALVADSSVASGIKWGSGGTKVAINTSSVTYAVGAASVANVIFSTSILAAAIGTENGVKFTGLIQKFGGADNFTIVANYGNNVVASITLVAATSIIGASGFIEGRIVARGTSSQLGYMTIMGGTPSYGPPGSGGKQTIFGTGIGNSSINSASSQDLVITGQFNAVSNQNSILTGLFVVEKIA